MKRFFITLFLCLLILPIIVEASATKMGRFYELNVCPIFSAHSSDRINFTNWAKQNFDEHNIPLISYMRAYNSRVLGSGIDSSFKYSQLETQARFFAWEYSSYFINPDSFPPRLIYHPHWARTEVSASDPFGPYHICSTGISGLAGSAIRSIVDNWEASNGYRQALVPLALHSEFKNGSIVGTVFYEFTLDATFFPLIIGNPDKANVSFQIILAEGYHKYGSEEFYFIPRKFLSNTEFGGNIMSMPTIPRSGTISFDFPVDKSWNTKYLYVIAIAESLPWNNSNINRRYLLDAAVDRAVDVSNASTHKPLRLELDYADNTPKCQKVNIGSNVNISFTITNPTPDPVKVQIYIDKNTSMLNKWTFTTNMSEVTIPGNGGKIPVTFQGKAPNMGAAAALDVCICPIDFIKNDENPLITNKLIIVATDSTKILALSNYANSSELLFMGNSYYENLSIIPDNYYSVVDVSMFDGYFFINENLANTGKFNRSDEALDYSLICGNFFPLANNGEFYTKAEEIFLSDPMNGEKVKFLNSIITANKHLALFTDRSPYYSTLTSTPTATRTEYTTLFNSFGVSFKNEIKTRNGYAASTFKLFGNSADPLAQYNNNSDSILSWVVNEYNANSFPAGVTDWSIAASKASRVFSYNMTNNVGAPDYNTVAAVKTTNGNQKLFLAGFGISNLGPQDIYAPSNLTNNITSWWFGKKVVGKPRISAQQYVDFGLVDEEQGQTEKDIKIPIRNIGTEPIDILRIYDNTGFVNNGDNIFTLVKGIKDQLPPGGVDTLIIKFKPTNNFEYKAIYRIYSNDPVSMVYDINLQGVGKVISGVKKPVIHIEQVDFYWNFGNYAIGDPVPAKEYLIYNAGNLPLEIYSIRLSDATDKDVFILSQTTNIHEISPQNWSEFRLRCTTIKSGDFDGEIIIESNDADKSVLILEFSVEIGNGIAEEIAKMFNCSISPNPASEDITIDFNVIGELPRNVVLNIVDNTGRLVRSISNSYYPPGNYKEQINISFLPAGVYYIEYIVDSKKSASSVTIIK